MDARNFQLRRSARHENSLPLDSNGLTLTGGGITIDRTPQRGLWNSRVPLPNSTTVADSFPDRREFGGGVFSSLTIGIDGLPVIAYREHEESVGETNRGHLNVLHCGNADCTSGNTVTTLDATEDTGWHASIAIGSDGLPVIAYHDFVNTPPNNGFRNLKVAKCGDLACSAGSTITTVDSGFAAFSSITIGREGFPVIAYSRPLGTSVPLLHVAACKNASCNSNNLVGIVSSGHAEDTPIAVGADGGLVISYFELKNQNLRVAWCTQAATDKQCSDLTVTTVDSAGDVGPNNSITIGEDGLPVISYFDRTRSAVKVAKCGNPACRCARGEYHGPYAYRHWRENGRQRKDYVARDRISEVLACIENRKRLAAPPWRVRQVLAGLWRIEKESISWPAT